jgi:hypothetical protein
MSAQFSIERSEDDGYPTVGLPFIMRELGKRHYGLGRQLAYVTLLIAEEGFPPPFPTLVKRRKGAPERLERGVTSDSQWPRPPVEAWIEDFLPPGSAAALDARAQAAAADEMDRAAGNLQLVHSQ